MDTPDRRESMCSPLSDKTAEVDGSLPQATAPVLGLHLLAGLNYEIRTPLTGILGMADLLLESTLSEEQAAWVRATRDCTESLFALLNLTLEYAALESGSAQLDEAPFVLRDAVGPALHLNPGVLPANVLERLFFGDACRLRQLVETLIQHSSRFGSGGAALSMEVLDAGAGLCRLKMRLSEGDPLEACPGVCLEDPSPASTNAGRLRRVSPGLLSFSLIRRLVALLRGELLPGPMRLSIPLRPY